MKLSRKVLFAILFLLFCPMVISVTYISCAPMKAKISDLSNYVSVTNASPANICDPTYAPSNSLLSKVTLDDSSIEPITSVFKNQKIIFNNSSLQKASDPDLKDTDIVIILDTRCAKNTPGALSQKITLQNDIDLHNITKRAFKYHIENNLKLSELHDQAEQDPCVIGITPPGTIHTASLELPSINDPDLHKQVHLKTLNYAHAYQYLAQLQSNSSAYVKIGFADTGVDCNHPDLQSNLVENCGYNVLSPNSPPTDNDGHGNHTAGTAAAVTGNGSGVIGIAGNNAKIFAIKVIDVNSGSIESLQTGIQQAITNRVDVLNISIESQTRLPVVEDAVIDAVNAGIVVVMAAGNFSQKLGVDIQVSPAMIGSVDGAITVGSIDASTGALSSFSNYGDAVEIAATGSVDSSKVGMAGGIYSLARMGLYQRLSGTSQAAPVVAAAAALLIQFFKHNSVSYTPAKIEKIIKASTDTTGIPISGGGRVLNFSKLVRNAYAYANVPLCE